MGVRLKKSSSSFLFERAICKEKLNEKASLITLVDKIEHNFNLKGKEIFKEFSPVIIGAHHVGSVFDSRKKISRLITEEINWMKYTDIDSNKILLLLLSNRRISDAQQLAKSRHLHSDLLNSILNVEEDQLENKYNEMINEKKYSEAACCLLNMNTVPSMDGTVKAVLLLLEHHRFWDAAIFVRLYLLPTDETFIKVFKEWAIHCLNERDKIIAAKCYILLEMYSLAAEALITSQDKLLSIVGFRLGSIAEEIIKNEENLLKLAKSVHFLHLAHYDWFGADRFGHLIGLTSHSNSIHGAHLTTLKSNECKECKRLPSGIDLKIVGQMKVMYDFLPKDFLVVVQFLLFPLQSLTLLSEIHQAINFRFYKLSSNRFNRCGDVVDWCKEIGIGKNFLSDIWTHWFNDLEIKPDWEFLIDTLNKPSFISTLECDKLYYHVAHNLTLGLLQIAANRNLEASKTFTTILDEIPRNKREYGNCIRHIYEEVLIDDFSGLIGVDGCKLKSVLQIVLKPKETQSDSDPIACLVNEMVNDVIKLCDSS